MPLAPPRACPCGGTVRDGRCDRCNRGRHTPHAQTTTQRGLGGDWRKLVKQREADAETCLCLMCNLIGIVRPATTRHHIHPRSERPDLRLEPTNIMDLCKRCHQDTEMAPRRQLVKLIGSEAAADEWTREYGPPTPTSLSLWARDQVKALESMNKS